MHSLSHKHGLRHHKLTAHHNPHMSGLLSEESVESAEAVVLVPVVEATLAPGADAHPAGDSASSMEMSDSKEVTVRFKRDVLAVQPDPILLVPVCPGRVRFF